MSRQLAIFASGAVAGILGCCAASPESGAWQIAVVVLGLGWVAVLLYASERRHERDAAVRRADEAGRALAEERHRRVRAETWCRVAVSMRKVAPESGLPPVSWLMAEANRGGPNPGGVVILPPRPRADVPLETGQPPVRTHRP